MNHLTRITFSAVAIGAGAMFVLTFWGVQPFLSSGFHNTFMFSVAVIWNSAPYAVLAGAAYVFRQWRLASAAVLGGAIFASTVCLWVYYELNLSPERLRFSDNEEMFFLVPARPILASWFTVLVAAILAWLEHAKRNKAAQ